MRSGAQMISYELSIGLSILTVVVFTGSMQLSTIVEGQVDGWLLFKGHIPACIAFIVYIIAGTAETNRGPFDLPEADSELTAGYHTEYSGMHFGFFYLAEYLNMFVVASGGQHPILRRLDAVTRSRLGKFQPNHGLHSFHLLVLRENSRGYIHHHVV